MNSFFVIVPTEKGKGRFSEQSEGGKKKEKGDRSRRNCAKRKGGTLLTNWDGGDLLGGGEKER